MRSASVSVNCAMPPRYGRTGPTIEIRSGTTLPFSNDGLDVRWTKLLGHLILIPLLHLPLDHHLTNQARREHLYADDDHDRAQQQERPVSDGVPEYDLIDGDPERHQKADHESLRPERAEKVHGPGREARQKDDRDQIQKPLDESIHPERSEEHTSELQSRENLVC